MPLLIASLVLAGCQTSPAGPGSTTPTATQPASRAPSAPSTTAGQTQAAAASAAATGAVAGTWTVTLGGPRDGAGTYTGTAFIICAAPTINGRLYWTATMINPAGPITEISLQQNSSGFDTVQATGPGGMETGSWFAQSGTAGQTARVAGSGGTAGAQVVGDGTFTDTQNTVYTIHASLSCSDTAM